MSYYKIEKQKLEQNLNDVQKMIDTTSSQTIAKPIVGRSTDDLKHFEVWSEGYAATGERSGAHLHGKATAETFDKACITVMGDSLDKNSDGSYRRGSYRGQPLSPSKDRASQMVGNYSIWACQLFDNEADARKSFG